MSERITREDFLIIWSRAQIPHWLVDPYTKTWHKSASLLSKVCTTNSSTKHGTLNLLSNYMHWNLWSESWSEALSHPSGNNMCKVSLMRELVFLNHLSRKGVHHPLRMSTLSILMFYSWYVLVQKHSLHLGN